MAALLTAALAIGGAASAASAAKMEIGFADGLYRSANDNKRQKWFEKSRKAGASIARIDAIWREIAPTKPLTPTNPNDAAYKWGTLDAAVADANAENLDPLLTVVQAPNWAEGPNRSGPAGTWKPDSEAYGDFARAVAARYGSQVRYYQAWNEPSLTVYLTPQYEGGELVGPNIYRRMLNEFYDGIHDADSTATVISGGTAPYGDPPGGNRTRPLVFIRDMLCLNGNNEPQNNCNTKAKFDALAHHPINTSGGPQNSAVHPDDVSTPDLHHVVDALRAAENGNTTGTGGRHEVWVTEFWWESKPPDSCTGIRTSLHKEWILEALRSFEDQGASVAINFLIRDEKSSNPNDCRATFQTGAYFANGKPKPALKSFKKYAK